MYILSMRMIKQKIYHPTRGGNLGEGAGCGRAGAAGYWEKELVAVLPSVVCIAAAAGYKEAIGMSMGGAGLLGGMGMENSPVMATACLAQMVTAVTSTGCGTGAETGAGGTCAVGGHGLIGRVGCRTGTGMAIGTSVGRAGTAGGRKRGQIVVTLSTAY